MLDAEPIPAPFETLKRRERRLDRGRGYNLRSGAALRD
jgi:hypothetical protein